MTILKTIPIVILSIVVVIGFLGSQVYGHASPTSYNPQQNQIFHSIQSIPDKLTIMFSEAPELKASTIKVTDEKSMRLDKNDLSIVITPVSVGADVQISFVTRQ